MKKKSAIGRTWIPKMNAVMAQPAHLARSTKFEDIVIHTMKQVPNLASGKVPGGFRWDRPADAYIRFGGQPPFSYVPDPLDQGACGSCWAFSTAMVFTSRYRIWFQKNIPMLSPSTILSCVATQYSNGCAGGLPSEAAQFCMDVGLPPLECADYNWCTSKTEYCSTAAGGGGLGTCQCEDSDRPTCDTYKQNISEQKCTVCKCPAAADSSCAKPACAATASAAASTVYSYVTLDNTGGGGSGSGNTVTLFERGGGDGGDSGGGLADLQMRIMFELFQHGPLQVSYYVMGDFYGAETGPMWSETNGIYMNVPDMTSPPLYANNGAKARCGGQPGATCSEGGHAVALIGFGAVKSTAVASDKFTSIRGPLELLARLGKPDAQLCCYWVCMNSWGPDWNSDQPMCNADGLSGGKWWHAITGTYEFTDVINGQVTQHMVNYDIALDHTVNIEPSSSSSSGGGSNRSRSLARQYGAPPSQSGGGGVFGGAIAWPPSSSMTRFPFSRSQFFSKVDKYAASSDLVACKQVTFSSATASKISSCVVVPAKYCTTEILESSPGKPLSTCAPGGGKSGADAGGGSDSDYTPEATTLPAHEFLTDPLFIIMILCAFGAVIGLGVYIYHKTSKKIIVEHPQKPIAHHQASAHGSSSHHHHHHPAAAHPAAAAPQPAASQPAAAVLPPAPAPAPAAAGMVIQIGSGSEYITGNENKLIGNTPSSSSTGGIGGSDKGGVPLDKSLRDQVLEIVRQAGVYE